MARDESKKSAAERRPLAVVMRPVAHVFGAGVAGMTAAHELAERGFKVKVYEPEVDPLDRRECAVGGLARTQWCRAPVLGYPPGFAPDLNRSGLMALAQPLKPRLGQAAASRSSRSSPLEFPFVEMSSDFFDYAGKGGKAAFDEVLDECVKEFAELLVSVPQDEEPGYVEVLDIEGVTATGESEAPSWLAEAETLLSDHSLDDLKGIQERIESGEAEPLSGIPVPDEGRWMKSRPGLDRVSTLLATRIAVSEGRYRLPGNVHQRRLSAQRARTLGVKLLEKLRLACAKLLQGAAQRDGIKIVRVFRPGDVYIWEIRRRSNDRHIGSIHTIPMGCAHLDDGRRPEDRCRYARLRLRQSLLPGEHGYRFFPSFYRHLRDTMKRIPVLRAQALSTLEYARYIELLRRNPSGPVMTGRSGTDVVSEARVPEETWTPTGRTVHDNLVALERYTISRAGDEGPWDMPRVMARSLRGVLALLKGFQQGMGFSLRDLVWMQLKCLKYLTSCPRRRDRYAAISWYDFLEADRCSKAFQEAMKIWPQALVGLRAEEADARTYGDVAMQLVLDQLNPEGYRDGTLNGPTSQAWFDPWRVYLQDAQGVEFVRGELCKLSIEPGTRVVERDGDDVRLAHCVRVDYRRGDETEFTQVPEDEYVVVAVPVVTAQGLARACKEDASAGEGAAARTKAFERSSLAATERMLDDRSGPFEASRVNQKQPDGPLRHFSGIQYYFAQDYRYFDGHMYVTDNQYALSAISQGQYRLDRLDRLEGFRGVLSVDVGEWGELWGKSPADVARQVFWAIDERFQNRWMEDGNPPEPLWFHIDDHLDFGEKKDSLCGNRSPYLVNLAGAYRRWPGRPEAYQVEFGRLVFAGTYMQTHTRLVTMESANESARHAVNAILRGRGTFPSDRVGQLCEVWPLVERELDDLAFLKKVDEALLRRGLPHMFEILEVEQVADELVPSATGAEEAAPSRVDIVDKIVATLEQLTAARPSSAGAFVLAPLQALLDGLRARR